MGSILALNEFLSFQKWRRHQRVLCYFVPNITFPKFGNTVSTFGCNVLKVRILLFESSDITFQCSDITFLFLEYIINFSSEKKFRIICVQLYTLGTGFQFYKAFLDVQKTFLHRVLPKSPFVWCPGTLLFVP